jgi:hypothetical protein
MNPYQQQNPQQNQQHHQTQYQYCSICLWNPTHQTGGHVQGQHGPSTPTPGFMRRYPCDSCGSFQHGHRDCPVQDFEKIALCLKSRADKKTAKEATAQKLNDYLHQAGLSNLAQPPPAPRWGAPYQQPQQQQPLQSNYQPYPPSNGNWNLPLPTPTFPPADPNQSHQPPAPIGDAHCLDWGDFYVDLLEPDKAADMTARLLPIHGFRAWGVLEGQSTRVRITFDTKVTAMSAKLLLSGMYINDASNTPRPAFMSTPYPAPVPKPKEAEESPPLKKARLDATTESRFAGLETTSKAQGQRLDQLASKLEETSREVVKVSSSVGTILQNQVAAGLRASPNWHVLGELDRATKKVLKRTAGLKKGSKIFILMPDEELNEYFVLYVQVMSVDKHLLEWETLENPVGEDGAAGEPEPGESLDSWAAKTAGEAAEKKEFLNDLLAKQKAEIEAATASPMEV